MKTSIKITILLITLIFLLIILMGILFLNTSITGNVIQNNSEMHMYTKAICNETNFCQDYEITCQGNEVIQKTPITGAVVQHQKDWQDPRNNSQNLCE